MSSAKNRFCPLLLALVLITAGSGWAEEQRQAPSGLDAVSYAAGFRIGDTFIKQKVTVIPEMLMRGLEDARNNRRPLLPNGEMRLILRDPRGYLITYTDKRDDLARQASQAFLQENAKKEGVNILESGLQYKIINSGAGDKPGLTDSVLVKYQGATVSGQVFDSTDRTGEPAILTVNQVVPGLAEGLQLMSPGGIWEFYVPETLGYASNNPLGKQALVFKVELLEILPNK